MADSYTSNLNLTKPEIGSSTDTWGGKINTDLDTLDSIFSATGTAVNQKFASANFDDNAKAIFGTGDDLEIYHDGSHSYVQDKGTGHLRLSGNDLQLVNGAVDANYIICANGGAVELYYGGSKKLETASGGVTVTGNIAVTGTVDGRDIATDGTKLDGIASGATNVTNNNQLTNGAGYVTTDTNTTYTAGTGISFTGASSTVINCTIDSPAEVGLPNLSLSGNNLSGDFVATGNITAYSDERLKDNIATIDNALDKVSKMRGVMFTKDGELSSGVIAQEMEQVAPELVKEGEYKSVAYGNTIGYLIEAIKELKAEINELKGA